MNILEKILNHTLIKVFALILTLLIIFSLRQSQKKALISKENLVASHDYVDNKAVKVEQDEQNLNLISDDLYIEKSFRNELLKQKEGEITLQVPLTTENIEFNQNHKQNPEETQKTHNFSLWWNLFF